MTRRRSRRTDAIVLAGTALLSACTSGSASLTGPDEGGRGSVASGEASCAAVVEYDRRRYLGYGDLVREPETTGRVGRGSVPACDDGEAATGYGVEVSELADVPMHRAVLVDGSVYVREGQRLPKAARSWFVPPPCTTDGRFELRGDWISAEGPHRPRFDGDLRPPYRWVSASARDHGSTSGRPSRSEPRSGRIPLSAPRTSRAPCGKGAGSSRTSNATTGPSSPSP